MSIVAHTLGDMYTEGSGLKAVPIVGAEERHIVGLIAAYREPYTPVLNALIEQARKVSWI